MGEPSAKSSPQSISPTARGVLLASKAARSVTDSVGRRGVRIYGVPSEDLYLSAFAIIFVGIPFFLFLSLIPIWDRIGALWWDAKLNSLIAPQINSLSGRIDPNSIVDFSLRRFMIAATTIVEFLFLGNFVSMFSRKMRKHALLVWICFDRNRLLLFTAMTGLLFVVLWYLLFYDWRIMEAVYTTRANKFLTYAVFAMPNIALLFGHLITIVILGSCRSAMRRTRLLLLKRTAARPATAMTS